MYSFKNDYSEGCSPEILEALIKTNTKQADGYGCDEFCEMAAVQIKKALNHNNVDIHFLPGGTPCNILAIASALRPYEAVIAHENGHINVHETGSIEACGHKILAVKGKDGKVTAEEVENICSINNNEHMVKPRMVFISNATECGTVYNKKELLDLRQACNRHGLYLYLDGARLSNVLALSDNDITLSDYCELCDMFYIGGTKNGALIGEAFVIVNDELKEGFRYNEKQRGMMLAKQRLIGISFYTLFKDNLYLHNASHANKSAAALKYVLQALEIPLLVDSKTNQLFPIFTNEAAEAISKKYGIEIWGKYDDDHTVVRLTTSWNTKDEAILEFASDLQKIIKE